MPHGLLHYLEQSQLTGKCTKLRTLFKVLVVIQLHLDVFTLTVQAFPKRAHNISELLDGSRHLLRTPFITLLALAPHNAATECIILGFTRDGHHLISYSLHPSSPVDNPGSGLYLQLWRFHPPAPCSLVFETPLFATAPTPTGELPGARDQLLLEIGIAAADVTTCLGRQSPVIFHQAFLTLHSGRRPLSQRPRN